MASECMECVEGRAVALGLCSHCLAGEPVEAVVRQIARLTRELEEVRALLRELTGHEPVLDDERLRYVEIQVNREAWEVARRDVCAHSSNRSESDGE